MRIQFNSSVTGRNTAPIFAGWQRKHDRRAVAQMLSLITAQLQQPIEPLNLSHLPADLRASIPAVKQALRTGSQLQGFQTLREIARIQIVMRDLQSRGQAKPTDFYLSQIERQKRNDLLHDAKIETDLFAEIASVKKPPAKKNSEITFDAVVLNHVIKDWVNAQNDHRKLVALVKAINLSEHYKAPSFLTRAIIGRLVHLQLTVEQPEDMADYLAAFPLPAAKAVRVKDLSPVAVKSDAAPLVFQTV